ncbi:hypothetical protein CRG98_010224 [Punica granatum]|uniref:Uncharacterized protein n=1 Tax=Punica granatum TaxID=22663 RepID=A0A2I0KNL9_PUNGR|nr:hypothetical protein CRG98_010224 [Punica granatum]
MAIRAVLINSTYAAIPSYFMQCSRLPQSTLSSLDRLNRDFLWSSTSDKRKLHLVSWKVVTKSKDMGGLDIHSMDIRDKALLSNLVSRASSPSTPGPASSATNSHQETQLGSTEGPATGGHL